MVTVDIFDLWQKIMSIVNVQQGGQIRPQTDFQNWLNAINKELFHEKCAKFGLNQQNADELAPFLKSVNVVVTQQPGRPYDLVQFPADYTYFANMKIIRQKDEFICGCQEQLPIIDGDGNCKQFVDPDYAALAAKYAGNNMVEKIVYLIDNQRWERALTHYTKGPSFDAPMVTQFDGGFKIAPKGISIVVLDYFRLPVDALFAYTVGDGDTVVYDAGASTQLEWTNAIQNEFLVRLEKYYGLAVQDQTILQVAMEDKKSLV